MADERAVDRDAVHYRARGFGPSAESLALLIVNLSPHGLMARLEGQYDQGQRIRINLPVVGVLAAEIRWCLGGRMGCQFDQAIDLASYYELLAAVLKR